MPLPSLAPETLDDAAERLHSTAAWQEIVRHWNTPDEAPPAPDAVLARDAVPAPDAVLAPEPPSGPDAVLAPEPPSGPDAVLGSEPPSGPDPAPASDSAPASEEWRRLLSVPVDQLVATALGALTAPAPTERPLPGRLGAVLPDRLHSWRRIGQEDVRPSVHLAHARRVLVEWGWQNQPYRLRDARGARCLCGALLTAHRLGHGSADTMNRSAAWIVTELRAQGWTGLIGPWNRAPGRTAEQALALVDATIRRAAHAGE